MSDRTPLAEDLVYDVGLHRGEDSAFYLAMGYRVVAFEANDALVKLCTERFSAEIAAGQMTIVEGAISSSAEPTVRFYKHPKSVWGTTDEKWVERNLVIAESHAVEVPVLDFTEMLRRTGIPSFMKIDIEGADRLCLEALLGFERRPVWLSIESSHDWSELEEEFALLERLGYDRFAVVPQARIPGSEILSTNRAGAPLRFRFEDDASGAFGPDVGPWLSRGEAIERYRRVFRTYRALGHGSVIRRTRIGRGLFGRAEKHLGRPLSGWFDTHAAHSASVAGPASPNGAPQMLGDDER